MIEEQMDYDEDMRLLTAEIGSLSTDDKSSPNDENDFRDFRSRTNFK